MFYIFPSMWPGQSCILVVVFHLLPYTGEVNKKKIMPTLYPIAPTLYVLVPPRPVTTQFCSLLRICLDMVLDPSSTKSRQGLVRGGDGVFILKGCSSYCRVYRDRGYPSLALFFFEKVVFIFDDVHERCPHQGFLYLFFIVCFKVAETVALRFLLQSFSLFRAEGDTSIFLDTARTKKKTKTISGRANYGKKWGKNGFRERKNVP